MFPKLFRRWSASYYCAKAAFWLTGQNLPCSRRSIFRICLAPQFGLVATTAISISIEWKRDALGEAAIFSRARSACLRDAVEKLDERKDGAVHALNFGIFRFDDVVFVRRMRAAAMTEAEGAGGKVKRLAGENVAGPGAGAARKNDGIDSAFAVDLGFNANERGVGRCAVGIVAAGHADFDVTETFFREMRFESGEGLGGGHVRNEAQIEFGDRFSGKNGFSAGSGVAADEAFDVHGGARHQEFEGFLPADVVYPVLDSEKFLRFGFAQALRGFGNHFLFRRGDGAGLRGEAFDGGIVAVG